MNKRCHNKIVNNCRKRRLSSAVLQDFSGDSLDFEILESRAMGDPLVESESVNLKRSIGLTTAVSIIVGGIIGE